MNNARKLTFIEVLLKFYYINVSILYIEKEVAVEKASQKITDLEAALKQEQESKVQLNKIKNNALKEITSLKNQNRVANEVFEIFIFHNAFLHF